MIPRSCENDTCGNVLDEDDVAFCSMDCYYEVRDRKEADCKSSVSFDCPEEPINSPLTKRKREQRYCFWCNEDFVGAPTRIYCSAACKLAAWRGGIRVVKTKSDRWAILDRDGFRCRYCGRSAREDGIKLHVDHIIPLSKGGSSQATNLITACQQCNIGKNARAPTSLIP